MMIALESKHVWIFSILSAQLKTVSAASREFKAGTAVLVVLQRSTTHPYSFLSHWRAVKELLIAQWVITVHVHVDPVNNQQGMKERSCITDLETQTTVLFVLDSFPRLFHLHTFLQATISGADLGTWRDFPGGLWYLNTKSPQRADTHAWIRPLYSRNSWSLRLLHH